MNKIIGLLFMLLLFSSCAAKNTLVVYQYDLGSEFDKVKLSDLDNEDFPIENDRQFNGNPTFKQNCFIRILKKEPDRRVGVCKFANNRIWIFGLYPTRKDFQKPEEYLQKYDGGFKRTEVGMIQKKQRSQFEAKLSKDKIKFERPVILMFHDWPELQSAL